MRKFEDTGWCERRFSRNEKFLESRSSQGQTQLAQVRKAITQTIVAKKREEVRDDLREAGDRARDRLGGYAVARISIFMEIVKMIKLTRLQNQSQIVQSCGTSWMVKNKKL